MAADAAKALVQLDGVELARPFVEHVARNRGESRPLRRIAGSADRQQSKKADQRHGMVLDRHHAQAVGQLPPADVGEPERRLGAE